MSLDTAWKGQESEDSGALIIYDKRDELMRVTPTHPSRDKEITHGLELKYEAMTAQPLVRHVLSSHRFWRLLLRKLVCSSQ